MTHSGFLKVEGENITLGGKPIILKGAGLGGWMNMENFITGYPGHEHQVRAALKKELGAEKYEFFFDKFLEYFFTEEDAKFYASLGLNCLRISINYRHFEDDMNPGVFKQEGLKHLDRVVALCAKYEIYTVIDLHAAPGGQNIDWHSDSGINKAMFWVHKDFQNRTVKIWEKLAEHYKDNTWVAGYNPLNEPSDEEHVRLVAFYERVEKAIRAVDPHHILFLDGNTFGMDLSHFGEPLPNCVYACHDYSFYGFPSAPELFTGTPEQVAFHERQFARKVEYMRKHKIPIWNGEFGPVYQSARDGIPDWEAVNERRFAVLRTQLDIYRRDRASWSIWLYKDIGYQGMVYVGEDTAYMRLLRPFLDKKAAFAVDAWGYDYSRVEATFAPLEAWLRAAAPSLETKYPPFWHTRMHLERVVRNCLLSEELCAEFAGYFRGKSEAELDTLARSFALTNCRERTTLNEILRDDARQAA